MTERCIQCGKKTSGGVFGGVTLPSKHEIDAAKQVGMAIPPGICTNCFQPFKEQVLKKAQEALESKSEEIRRLLGNIQLSTFPPESGQPFKNLGIVTVQAIMGMEPISQLAPLMTNFFEKKSGDSSNKLRQGVNYCITKLQYEAAKMNANSIYGINITYTTVFTCIGMNLIDLETQLLVCITGTAIEKEGLPGGNIKERCKSLVEDKKLLENRIIALGGSIKKTW